MQGFDFGSNWDVFSAKKIDARRLAQASESLRLLLQRDSLLGLSFLDVGCGSGLFSIAACQLGAVKVMGIDINPACIVVSTRNRDQLAPGSTITFQIASALDRSRLNELGQFDIVYAWGSLHHTGAMWNAVCNVARLVAPGGTLVLAIYNRHVTSPVWKRIKWFYNRLPRLGQQVMTILFAGIIYVAKLLVTRRNPLEKERGMDFWYDVIDWIGGYPYEYATPQEVKSYVSTLGCTLRYLVKAQMPTGCNEFVFERVAE
jgi:2-polyprenyl-6-hydroxyphenyl methylase/3-demethylubiquinone-9 3-methyltransferase